MVLRAGKTLFLLLLIPNILIAKPQKALKKIIFLDFYNQNADPNYRWLETNISENLHEMAKKKYRYIKISKEKWQQTARKLGFQPKDFINIKKLSLLGKNLGAHGIVFGHFYVNSNNQMKISGKILSVLDKEVIGEKTIVTPISNKMFDDLKLVSKSLAKQIRNLFIPSDKKAALYSAMLPGLGQFYKQRPRWGIFWASAVGSSFLFASVFTVLTITSRNAYSNAGPGENALEIYNRAESQRKIMIVSWIVTGILYGANILDAWYFQGDYGNVLQTSGKKLSLHIQQEEQEANIQIQFSYSWAGVSNKEVNSL